MSLAKGARQLPVHHLTIRVPWHDAGWDGTVCRQPRENTSCLVLNRIAAQKDDGAEAAFAGRRLDVLREEDRPSCTEEHATFMAPVPLRRNVRHPYTESSPETHGHLQQTTFDHPAYSAALIPFRWMLKESVEGGRNDEQGIADALRLGYEPQREPTVEFMGTWVQHGDNQRVVLDTFFSAIRPEESLCFFYAKATPLSDDRRRVIVGVGRVTAVGAPTSYKVQPGAPPSALRPLIWERNVTHSIRPDFEDGFIFPYQQILELAEQDASIRPSELVAFAPDEYHDDYSYGTEHIGHDGAISSLVACAATLERIKNKVPGSWNGPLAWISRELNRLWKALGRQEGQRPRLLRRRPCVGIEDRRRTPPLCREDVPHRCISRQG